MFGGQSTAASEYQSLKAAAAFVDAVSLPLDALKATLSAYFAMLDAALSFAGHTRLASRLYYLSPEEAAARDGSATRAGNEQSGGR